MKILTKGEYTLTDCEDFQIELKISKCEGEKLIFALSGLHAENSFGQVCQGEELRLQSKLMQ
jgi:hypothetical protein